MASRSRKSSSPSRSMRYSRAAFSTIARTASRLGGVDRRRSGVEAGRRDPGAEQEAEVVEIARGQPHPEMLFHEFVEHRGEASLVVDRAVGQGMPALGAVHRDGEVQQHGAESVVVDLVAVGHESGDEVRLERGEVAGREPALDAVDFAHPPVRLVTEQSADESPPGRLRAFELHPFAGAHDGETGGARTGAGAGEVRFERRIAHVQLLGEFEEVDPVGAGRGVEQRPQHGRHPHGGGGDGVGTFVSEAACPLAAVESVARGTRLDERGGGGRVEGGDVPADAAVGDPEARREVGRRRPASVLRECVRELLVPICHPTPAPLRTRRPSQASDAGRRRVVRRIFRGCGSSPGGGRDAGGAHWACPPGEGTGGPWTSVPGRHRRRRDFRAAVRDAEANP